MKYATPNWSICSTARTPCCGSVGRSNVGGLVPGSRPLSSSLSSLLVDPEAIRSVVALAVLSFLSGRYSVALLKTREAQFVDEKGLLVALETMYRSYSRLRRRRNSSAQTRQMTPMQLPANIPLEVMCQVEEIKPCGSTCQYSLLRTTAQSQRWMGVRDLQASMVSQFHNICAFDNGQQTYRCRANSTDRDFARARPHTH